MVRPRSKAALLLFVYSTAIALLEFTYRYLDIITRQHHEPWLVTFIEQGTGCYGSVVMILLAWWAVRRYPLDSDSWARNLPKHIALVLAGSAVHTTLNWGSRLLLFPLAGLGHYDYGTMPTRYFMELPVDVISYAIWAGLTTLYYRQIRSVQLEKTLAQAQLQNLRLQLNPHFLFNTLNTISSVMYEDVRAADRMIARLSDLLRSTLEQGDAQEVTLEREIEFLRLYVETMKARFEERLEVDVEASIEARGAMVPPLVLQPVSRRAARWSLRWCFNRWSKTRLNMARIGARRRCASKCARRARTDPCASKSATTAPASSAKSSTASDFRTQRSAWSGSTEARTAWTSIMPTTVA
ncbi:MAG: histidine kinase [Bryobacteraceae bacterium]